jgi:hypothetical protein
MPQAATPSIRPALSPASAPHRRLLVDAARAWFLQSLNGRLHRRALTLYAAVVATHFAEHVTQVGQVYLLGWARPEAGGLLGLVFPGLVAAEVLHTLWNSLQLTGLILLLPGFGIVRPARHWWTVALVLQTWHWFEHALLQFQYVTGIYFFGAVKQMSILERVVPRIELHMLYNLLVFIPTVIAVGTYLWHLRRAARHAG